MTTENVERADAFRWCGELTTKEKENILSGIGTKTPTDKQIEDLYLLIYFNRPTYGGNKAKN